MYKLCGTKYDVMPTSAVPPDGYALNGYLVSTIPSKGKKVGYVELDDGSIVECYKWTNPLFIVLPIVAVILIVVICIAVILLSQKKDIVIGGTVIRESMDDTIIVYNGLMAYSGGAVDIMFENGKYPTTVTLSGDGITTTQATLQPGEVLTTLPVEIDTEMDVIEAVLSFETETSLASYPVLIEIPDNMNGTAGISNYFEKEGIIDG